MPVPAPAALQKHAREILSSVDDYAREVQDIKNFRQGELTVGIPVTRGTIMLPPLLSAFHQLFPQIRLHLVEGTASGNIAERKVAGGIHIPVRLRLSSYHTGFNSVRRRCSNGFRYVFGIR